MIAVTKMDMAMVPNIVPAKAPLLRNTLEESATKKMTNQNFK